MPRIINENSQPREYWVTYYTAHGGVERVHGERPDGASQRHNYESLNGE